MSDHSIISNYNNQLVNSSINLEIIEYVNNIRNLVRPDLNVEFQ